VSKVPGGSVGIDYLGTVVKDLEGEILDVGLGGHVVGN
jgi:hypothetical protein